MCTGGRIVHHLFNRLPRPQDTLLLIGYQAEGTRGRRLQNGENGIKMFGEMVPVRCHVEQLDGFSAHADRPSCCAGWASFRPPPNIRSLCTASPARPRPWPKHYVKTWAGPTW